MIGRGKTYVAVVVVALALVAGAAGTVMASPGGDPAPTADPDGLSVSLTDGDGTANATDRVNTTSETINASYAGSESDENVSYTASATAIQFALDNATAENDTSSRLRRPASPHSR